MEGRFDAFLSSHECLAQKLPQDDVENGKRIAVWPSVSFLPLGAGYVSATRGPKAEILHRKRQPRTGPVSGR